MNQPEMPIVELERVNILLVDDRPDKLTALETILADFNQNIMKAASGNDALRLLLRYDFAVILLDVNMPGLDGFETAALIRQRKRCESTPIIFVTGIHLTDTHVSRGYSLGAVDYISSPVIPEILHAKVSVFIDLFQKTQQVKRQGEMLLAAAERRASGVEDRFQTLLNSLDVGVFRCSADCRLIDANPAFLRLVGARTLDEARQLDLTPLCKSEHLVDGASDQLSSEAERGRDVKLARADGGTAWLLLTGMRNEHHHQGAIVEGLIEDISFRKKAEEALIESDRRKDEFLAMLSHELRNPLAAISNAVHLTAKGTNPKQLELAQQIMNRQVKNLSRLIDDLLDVSRISHNKIVLKKEIVNIIEVVQRALTTSQSLFAEKMHQLEVTLPSQALYVEADITRIEQVIVNLLNNAAKYTRSAGKITVSLTSSEDQICVVISDSGIGIAPDMLSKVFDLFLQLDSGIDRSEGGLGIGLTVVRKLVELHGGAVHAHSDGLGCGSTFTVTLPRIVPKREIECSAPSKDTTKTRRGRRVLVVDDNVDTANLSAQLLRMSGFVVETVHDGLDAVRVAEELNPEIVLLDIGLPGIDGFEVARRLRASSKLKDPCLIAVSGYGRQQDRQESSQAGFNYHLVKPVDYDQLLNLLITGDPGSLHAEVSVSAA